ncbi:MAG: hypothetical protein ACLP9L_04785 [Thermoguttaceae bacterium]
MHLWRVTFRVGDFGTKVLSITTADRAGGEPDAEGNPQGGFAEVEHRALQATQSETSGWPTPVEMLLIEYLDEISAPPATLPAKTKTRR